MNYNIKMKIEFEKQMNRLKAVTGENVAANEKVSSLISWFRNEYTARPEAYIGDQWPIELIVKNVAKGFNLDLAIQETYDMLKIHFFVIDKRHSYKSNSI